MNEALVVSSADNFEKRLRQDKWLYVEDEFNELKKFIYAMDNKYGKDEHSWGRQSMFAMKYPEFYERLDGWQSVQSIQEI